MEDNKTVLIEEIHKEIDLIQSCISRMAQNSFMIKGWLITIYAVVLALLPEKIDLLLLCIVMAIVTWSFWYLDGFFLRTEKIYRSIYNWVLIERPKGNRKLLYQLNSQLFKDIIEPTESIAKIMKSKTLITFYGIPFLFVIIIVFIQILPYICNLCK
jgi:hypothetical protein